MPMVSHTELRLDDLFLAAIRLAASQRATLLSRCGCRRQAKDDLGLTGQRPTKSAETQVRVLAP